ncbi:MAG TPA: hypothetical protein VEL05_06550, partial [Candidatus Acidoferrum sp.]|nr:hypothetical protein [Candidatus Acidoferrum sp.]
MMVSARATPVPFDERGVYVEGIRLSMTVGGDRGAWREFLGRLPPSLKPAADTANWAAAHLVALPLEFAAHALFFEAQVNVVDELEDEVAAWEMALLRMPSTPPPRALSEASGQLGGYPAVLERLATSWPAAQPATVKHTVTYWASPTMWKGVKGAPLPKAVTL